MMQGHRDIAFGAAVFLTEFLWHNLEITDAIALLPEGVTDVCSLLRVHSQLLKATGSPRSDMRQRRGHLFSSEDERDENLCAPWISFAENTHFQCRWDESQYSSGKPPRLFARQTPHDCVKPRPNFLRDKLCFNMMIESIHKNLKPIRESNFDEVSGTYHQNSLASPGALVFWTFFGNQLQESELIHGVESCLSLRLVLESHRSYIWPVSRPTASSQIPVSGWSAVSVMPRPNSENCRLKVLYFAQAFQKFAEQLQRHPLFGCACENGIPDIADTFIRYLKLVGADVKYSLYFQAPWVTGSQLLSLAQSACLHDLDAIGSSCCVEAVLHVYNVLTRYKVLKLVALLERLCHLFRDTVFMGGKPTGNYKNCYVISDGGRPKGALEVNERERLQRLDRRLERIQGTKLSFYHVVQDAKWKLHQSNTLAEVYDFPKERLPLTSEKLESWKASLSGSVELEDRVRERVLKDFEGDFPAARLNLLAVFLACADILRRVMPVHERNIAAAVAGECPHKLLTIEHEVAEALTQVDVFEDVSGARDELPLTCLIRKWVEPIEEVMNARKPKDFLWEELV